MRDSIYTIPISEVFEPKCGCPLCRMRDMLEARCIEYIMGAAMMEPDVRIETNRLSFCDDHFAMMLKQKNRLSLALILESLLKELSQKGSQSILEKVTAKEKKQAGMTTINDTCFVCSQIEEAMGKMLDTVLKLYFEQPDFKKLFEEQEYLCYPHLEMILSAAAKKFGKLNRKKFDAFSSAAVALSENYLKQLSGDVSHFCQMYDYRNVGGDWGNSKDSIERAIAFLVTRDYRTRP